MCSKRLVAVLPRKASLEPESDAGNGWDGAEDDEDRFVTKRIRLLHLFFPRFTNHFAIFSEPNDSARSDNPDRVFQSLTTSPQTSMRHLSFQMELRSLKDKKGSSRIFKKMSDVRQIGDIERVHRENRGVRERKKSVNFDKIKYGRRGECQCCLFLCVKFLSISCSTLQPYTHSPPHPHPPPPSLARFP